MRQLSPGDAARKLAQIEQSGRSRRWKKRARANLIKDIKATPVPGTDHLDVPNGRICAKRRYPCFSHAFQALIDTWRSPNPARHEKRVYPCSYCAGWHMTSRDFHEDHDNGRSEEKPDKHRREAREDEGHSNRYPQGR